MLVLSRKVGELIDIGNQIQVKVVAIEGQRVRLGIEAPAEVPIRRSELAAWPVASAPADDPPSSPIQTNLWTPPAPYPPSLPR